MVNKKVIIRTCAYNSESTIKRAINSVLVQNFDGYDPIYIIVDNGSIDKTGAIIKMFASKYSWIYPVYNKNNERGLFVQHIGKILDAITGDGYFMCLDADDEYKPGFFHEMLSFLEKNELDIAACGSDFIDAENKRILGCRALETSCIMKNSFDYSSQFPMYHQFLRTIWGKLIKLKVLRQCSFVPMRENSYGLDTACILEIVSKSVRFGILNSRLHNYYYSVKSVSHQFNFRRIKSDQSVHELTIKFLQDKCGYVNDINKDFLLLIYMNALIDTLNVLLNAPIKTEEMIDGLTQICEYRYTRQLAAYTGLGSHFNMAEDCQSKRYKFFFSIVQWLLSISEIPDEQAIDYCNLGVFCCAASEYGNGWIHFQKIKINVLLQKKMYEEAKKLFEELEKVLPEDDEFILDLLVFFKEQKKEEYHPHTDT